MNYFETLLGCTYLSDRAKLKELKNDKLLLCLYYLMIKFESWNQFHNILRLFNVLPNFSFRKSETMRDYYLQT